MIYKSRKGVEIHLENISYSQVLIFHDFAIFTPYEKGQLAAFDIFVTFSKDTENEQFSFKLMIELCFKAKPKPVLFRILKLWYL